MNFGQRYLIVGIALTAGACSGSAPLPISFGPKPVETACETDEARISFDFPAASLSRCVIEGPREFSVLVTPEHMPPINPSPWYAFRYKASEGGDVTVTLRYLGGQHRYAPIWNDGSTERQLAAEVGPDRERAVLTLPPGKAIVSAQEIVDESRYRKSLKRWARGKHAKRFTLGRSHDDRRIEAVSIGNPAASRLVILIGRQHPPEVTGALGMEAFVDRIAAMVAQDPSLGDRYRFLVIPLLNPDGVARGNWRANLGGRDLNRDWGIFSQPETQAVRQWLDALPGHVRPVLLLDFHSTFRNLVYVQGEEADAVGERFLAGWLSGREADFSGYPFTIEPRNANPGSGTTKNWFHETYGIPAYTYEVADDADREGIRTAATALASSLPDALDRAYGPEDR